MLPSRTATAPADSSSASSSVDTPPSGPTTSDDVAGIRQARPRRAASPRPRGARRPPPRRGPGPRGRPSSPPARGPAAGCGATASSRRRARRPTCASAFSPRSPAPADHAARRLPGNHLVDAELGGGLDRLVVAVVLGQRLHEHEPRPRVADRWSTDERRGGPARPRPPPRPLPRPAGRHRPRPGACSPTRVRRTVAACRPSGPSRTSDVTRAEPGERLARHEVQGQGHRSTEPSGGGASGQRALNASRSLPNREPSPGWPTRPSGRSSPRGLGELAQQLLLLGVEPGRRLRPRRARRGRRGRCRAGAVTPSPAAVIVSAGLGARPHVEVARPVERLQRHRRAQCGRRHRHLDRAVQVVALALEHRVRLLDDLDVQVAGRAAAGARPRPRRRAGCGCRCRRRRAP